VCENDNLSGTTKVAVKIRGKEHLKRKTLIRVLVPILVKMELCENL